MEEQRMSNQQIADILQHMADYDFRLVKQAVEQAAERLKAISEARDN
jgi:hypothetical protein